MVTAGAGALMPDTGWAGLPAPPLAAANSRPAAAVLPAAARPAAARIGGPLGREPELASGVPEALEPAELAALLSAVAGGTPMEGAELVEPLGAVPEHALATASKIPRVSWINVVRCKLSMSLSVAGDVRVPRDALNHSRPPMSHREPQLSAARRVKPASWLTSTMIVLRESRGFGLAQTCALRV